MSEAFPPAGEQVREPVPPRRWWLLGALLGRGGMHAAFLQTMATQVLVVLVNVATGVIAARLLGPEGRGTLAAITLWPQLLATFAVSGLPYALVYHLRQAPQQTSRVLGAGLALGVGLAVLATAAGVIAIPFAMSHGYPPATVAFAQAGALLTVANLTAMLLKRVLGALDLQLLANQFGVADPVIYLVLLLLAWAVAPLTPEAAAACLFLGPLATLLIMLRVIYVRCRPSLAEGWAWTQCIGAYTLRAAPASLLASMTSYLDRLILVALITPEELGLYAVAFALSRLVDVVQGAVSSVGFAAMAGRDRAGIKALHDQVFRFVLLAVCVIVAGGFVLGGPAIRLVYGEDFAPANLMFRLLVVEAALGCLGQVVAQLYFGLGRPGQVSAVQGVSFCTSLAAMLALVSSLGGVGAAVGLMLGSAVRLALLLGGVRVALGMALPRLAPEPGEVSRLWNQLRRA